MFTWSKKCRGSLVLERLNKSFYNEEWSNIFPVAVEKHIGFWGSDHCPILLEFTGCAEGRVCGNGRRKSRYCYEEGWADHDECSKIVSEC